MAGKISDLVTADVADPTLAGYLEWLDGADTSMAATGTNKATSFQRLLALCSPVSQLRLTLTSGTPVTTTDVTGATTVYLTPYVGNVVRVYDGTRWKLYATTELSLALGTLTSGKNYDVFLYDSSGTLTLKLGPAWSGDTSRGTGAGTTELTTQDGVYVNANSITSGPGAKAGLYVGTIRTTSTTTTEDSATKRFCWNLYNQAALSWINLEATNTWSLGASSVWSQRASKQVEAVLGQPSSVRVQVHIFASPGTPGSSAACVAVGSDSTSTPDTTYGVTGQTNYPTGIMAAVEKTESIGYHYYAWLENAAVAAAVFNSVETSPTRKRGMIGQVYG